MRIVVTGTSGGVGSAVAARARARDWEVIEVNRAQFLSTAALVEERDIGAVVFATGCCQVKSLLQTTDEAFAETIAVNCGYFLRLMRELVCGRRYDPSGMKVLAISSVSATERWPGGAAYCASKGALSALCRALDAELSPKRITVRALEPRYIRTRMFSEGAMRMGVPANLAVSSDDFAAEVIGYLV